MILSYYETLGVRSSASLEEVRRAYERQLRRIAHRLEDAKRSGAPLTELMQEEQKLREAMLVLTDPVRRRRYELYRSSSDAGLPEDAAKLWEYCQAAMIRPQSLDGLRLLASLTRLPIRELSLLQSRRRSKGDAGYAGFEEDSKTASIAAQSEEQGQQRRRESIDTIAPPATSSKQTATKTARPQLTKPAASQPTQQRKSAAKIAVQGRSSSTASVSVASTQSAFAENPTEVTPRAQVNRALVGASKRSAVPRETASAANQQIIHTVQELAQRYGHDGRFFKAVRELRGVSITEASNATRISELHLQAIEQNAFDQLPVRLYVRGYIKSLVRLLALENPNQVIGDYMSLYEERL